MRNKSTQRTLGSMLMAFESFVVFFATLVAFGLKVADGPTVWAIGLALSFLLIMTPAEVLLRMGLVFADCRGCPGNLGTADVCHRWNFCMSMGLGDDCRWHN